MNSLYPVYQLFLGLSIFQDDNKPKLQREMEGNFIITGAALGFGREFTRRVLTSGGRVVMADINQAEGAKTCQQFGQVLPATIQCYV